jgi:glucose/mannose transport system substrate-binding protein
MRKLWLTLILTLGSLAMAQSGKLEIFSWWAGDEGPALQALIDLYKKRYPNVEVINATVTGGAGVNAKAVLKTRMLGGDPPRRLPGACWSGAHWHLGGGRPHGRPNRFV